MTRRAVVGVVIGLTTIALAVSGASVTVAASLAPIEPRVTAEIAANGKTTFWVVLRERADLGAASAVPDWAARGRFVHERLREVAARTQTPLLALLRKHRAEFRSFWIANMIRVTAGTEVLDELAARPEVAQILADRVVEIPEPTPGTREQSIQAIEWNIDRIGAPLVWSTFGVRGEGIVIANIDTGVQFNHPALVRQYRGNLGGGNFDHNYNWHDPSQVCVPASVPCDNNDHGTHTMGTMVEDDGDPGPNQIGVAPHARWIAAKGCESNSCSFSALLSSGQWVLAPTDLAGQNPRPDLRPHVVNNSWGGGGGDTFYQATVDAWVASGIFPAFANGNSGPFCNTSGSPGDYPNSYGVGAFDINNVIASFSSRGPSAFAGELKPNVSAPGVNVRSSVTGDLYASFSGTSMATPHVAATVALIWSAAPAIERDIAATRTLLDQTATDVADASCGGTAADNNVWGEGRLNAFAAVDQAPRGPTGTLSGTVTDAGSGAPVAGATVEVVGPATRSTTTNGSGLYSLRLPVGTYDVTARAFGFVSQTALGIVVAQDQTTVQNFALARAPSQPVSGHVRDSGGAAIAGATVTILGTPLAPATTDAAGFYSFASVPEGTYDARAEGGGRCSSPQTRPLVVAGGPVTLDFALPRRSDSFGYTCDVVPFAFVDANTVLPLTGDDSSLAVTLPFAFPLYGQAHTTAHVSTNGFVNFVAPDASFFNSAIPSAIAPNGAVYAFWDDLFVDASASVRTQSLGTAPNRRLVIEWRNVAFFGDFSRRVRIEIVLHEDGRILTQYAELAADAREQGGSATVGLENHAGTVAFQYSFDEAALTDALAVLYRAGPQGTVTGRVTDANDGLGIAGATVRALQGGAEVARTSTGSDGTYGLSLQPGTYTIEASATNYSTGTAEAVVGDGQVVVRDFVLTTARAEVTPSSLSYTLAPGQSGAQTLTLRSTGSNALIWSLREDPAVAWLTEVPTSGTVPVGGTQPIQVTANATALAPGLYTTTLRLDSNSGRAPSIAVPVQLTVTGAVLYDRPVNVAGGAFTDAAGIVWAADRAFNGDWGFTRAGAIVSTTSPIAGTVDDPLYQDARVGRVEYRFERLPAGVYEVQLRFAEIQGRLPGQRVFDVFIDAQDRVALRNLDIAARVGQLTADDHSVFVRVRDRIEIRLQGPAGQAIINAIRVRHRPDR